MTPVTKLRPRLLSFSFRCHLMWPSRNISIRWESQWTGCPGLWSSHDGPGQIPWCFFEHGVPTRNFSEDSYIKRTWRRGGVVNHLLRIREVSGSNIGLETGYPGWGSWFSSVPPGECWDSILKLCRDRFLPNPFLSTIYTVVVSPPGRAYNAVYCTVQSSALSASVLR
jgi:hypothetical protein